jgi:hypothetical protein
VRLYLKNKLGVVVHIFNPNYLGCEAEGSWSKVRLGKKIRPYQKKIKAKWGEGMSQVVECLPSKCGALYQYSATPKEKT